MISCSKFGNLNQIENRPLSKMKDREVKSDIVPIGEILNSKLQIENAKQTGSSESLLVY